ncbi:KAP family P-loop NTPase fold protein [Micromonospora saelicesensis]|uniref:KAP family P-loop domain-containing protein n=1 Tax=Micromonospora saelicesensis TaxID=285676 RepID=A0A1C4YEX0_9ACTN|nr:P-loop NTPase fold protein [Micromonospora saelicesensis]SCF19265.1 KAP family P-loop domain-containing protein [Micromonospora saelicesensis]
MASVGDNPISGAEHDLLKRSVGAANIAGGIRDVDASGGYVVGVFGPWGSGKTSIVNMIGEALRAEPALPVIEFNPWMFSGTDELVQTFFRELAAQMRLKGPKVAAIAESVNTYADLLSPVEALPVVGAWFNRFRGATKVIAEYQEKRKGSIADQRHKLAVELAKLDRPIVVVIDDIDRLESTEIRDIFKLVRLTASFPNLVYVLALDRVRVEAALGQSGFDGRAYLEKIIQLGIDVPSVPNSVLLRLLGESLQEAVSDLGVLERFDEEAWPDILMEIVRPLITNMRDIARYCAAVRATSRTLGSQVEFVDVLALEAIRVFLPDVFQSVVAGRDGLTTTSSASFNPRYENPRLKEQVDAVVAGGAKKPEVVKALIERIFPAARRHIGSNNYDSSWQSGWLRGRRVAHPDVFALYLEQVSNDGMRAFGNAEAAFALLDDERALDALLRSCEISELEDVVSALEAFETEFPVDAVVPASRVLLNLLPDMPERPRGIMTLVDARLVVVRVVLRLLRRLETPDEVMDAANSILPEVPHFASRFELITIVGYREGAGHRLVSETDAKVLEKQFHEQLAAAPSSRLANEKGLLRLLYSPKFFGDDADVVHVDPKDIPLCRALLLDAQSIVRSQQVDRRSVQKSVRMNWDVLVEVLGGEPAVKEAVDALRSTADDELNSAIELADKYLSGWRPSEWGDD